MTQEKTALVESNLENLPASQHGQELQPETAFNPMFPWANMLPGLQIDYQQVEVRLQGKQTQIKGKRASYRGGVIKQESINVQGPSELYLDAVRNMQIQMQETMKLMFLPWSGMMGHRERRSDKD